MALPKWPFWVWFGQDLEPHTEKGAGLKYLPLVMAGLWRKPARTVLTFLSIVVAFVLFGILSAIDAGFAHQLEAARLDRLFADPRFGGLMPIAYAGKIAAVPGVTVVAPRMGLDGYYKDPKDGMGVIMTDARFFAARPELTAIRQQIEQLQRTPSGALVGSYFVEKYGWKVGDTIPLISNTVKRDGSRVWTFDILGIIEDTDNPGPSGYFVGNYRYLDEARVTDKGTTDRFLVRIKDPRLATQISRSIDQLFDNSPAPTRTGSEKAQAQSGLQSLGDMNFLTHAVITAVIFMLLFLTGNTMMQSVRERGSEFAVLKTLGFSDMRVLALVFAESLLLCLLAGMTGLALSEIAVPLIHKSMPEVADLLRMSWGALLPGMGFALLVAFLSALIPGLRAKRLKIVDALANR
jgi:putative ABC transport system permease protein